MGECELESSESPNNLAGDGSLDTIFLKSFKIHDEVFFITNLAEFSSSFQFSKYDDFIPKCF